jgi:hypothetical protein
MANPAATLPITENLEEFNKPHLPVGSILGVLAMTGSCALYSAAGLSAYPRQEWIMEILVNALFLIPVVNLLRGGGNLSTFVRVLGLMLIVHTGWDAFHWPGSPLIDTPVDPWVPKSLPWFKIPLGVWLIVRGL